MSPFFIGHGYHVEPIQQKQVELTLEEWRALSAPAKRAQAFVERLVEAEEYAAAAIALVQDRMEESANCTCALAEKYEVGDTV
jgi:hypothetical protein